MAKHKAGFWQRPAAYQPWAVADAYNKFREAILSEDWDGARKLRMRGRQGSLVRAWSETLGRNS